MGVNVFYYCIKRKNNHLVVWLGRSAVLPDVTALLNNQAGAAGGTADDYEFVIIAPEVFDMLAASILLSPLLLPDGTVRLAGINFADFAAQQLARFKRGYLVHKKFASVLDRKVTPLWQPV